MKGKCFKEPIFNGVVNGTATQFREIIISRTGFFNVNSKNGLVTSVWQCDANGWNGENLIPVKPRFKPGETVYLKEPYIDEENDWVGNLLQSYLGKEPQESKVRSATQMPERLAKHFIEITGVKAERLQDNTDSDCVKQGIRLNPRYDDDVRDEKILISSIAYIATYADLIDEIHGKDTWESNPFVWVYDFKLIK
jgi:hypothetical protein